MAASKCRILEAGYSSAAAMTNDSISGKRRCLCFAHPSGGATTLTGRVVSLLATVLLGGKISRIQSIVAET